MAPQWRSWLQLVVFGIPSATCFGLGAWQWQRRQWKRELIRERAEQLRQQPLRGNAAVLEALRHDAQAHQFRQVELTGRLLPGETKLVGPRSPPLHAVDTVSRRDNRIGYYVVVPLQMEEDNVERPLQVLVNRGWIPRSVADAYRNAQGDGAGEATAAVVEPLRGVIRGGETPGRFTPENRPERGEWYYFNVAEMGGDVLVDALADDPLAVIPPIGKCIEDFLQFSITPQTHAMYSATWFTMSAVLAAMAVMLHRRPGKAPATAGRGAAAVSAPHK